MPSAPLRPCNSPGCTELVPSGPAARLARGRCPIHARAVQAKRSRHFTDVHGRNLYKSTRWVHLRSAFLARHPFCGDRNPVAPETNDSACRASGVVARANTVDHIQRHGGDPTLMFRIDNLQSLCGRCHGRKTAKEVHFGHVR
jgi:5-methylcytosine-specific restriction protein A